MNDKDKVGLGFLLCRESLTLFGAWLALKLHIKKYNPAEITAMRLKHQLVRERMKDVIG